jgi:hypothetical protein
MALTKYELGEVAQLDFTVRNVSNTLTNASTLTAEARRPDNTLADISGLITNSATGVYQILLPLTEAGDWNIKIVTVNPDDTKRFGLFVEPDNVDTSQIAAYALTSLANARAWVLRDASADSQDDLLTLCINAASQAIINYTDREFSPTDNDTRTINYDGEGVLSLSPWDLRSITEFLLTADGQSVSQTLSNRFYKLEPAQKTPEGTYLNIRVADAGWWPMLAANASYWRFPMFGGGYQATITGDWGCAEVPSDVEMACLVTVDDAYRNPGSVTSFAQGGGFVAGEPLSGPIGSIPIGARRLLLPYKRQRRVGSVRLTPRNDDYLPVW